MTDVLLKPEDTGDIPRADTGETTRRMHPMIATGPFPTLRSADALTVAQSPLPQSIGIVDPPRVREPAAVLELIEEAATSPIGMPVPPTTPDPKADRVEVLWEEIVGTGEYLEKRSVPLAMAVQRIGRAL